MEHRQLGRVQIGLVIALSDLAQDTGESRHKLLDVQFIRIGDCDCGSIAIAIAVVLMMRLRMVRM